MKIDQSAFAAALSSAARVAASGGIAIINCVRMDATDGKLTIHATDLTLWLERTIECEGSLPPVAVNAARLAEVIANMRPCQLDVSVDGDALIVKGQAGSRRKIQTLAATDFPAPKPIDAPSCVIENDQFRQAMEFVMPHMHTESTHDYLCGVRVHPQGDGMRAVATDGKSMAYMEFGSGKLDVAATIGKPFIDTALRDMPEGGQSELAISDKMVSISRENFTLRGPIVEGDFIDYARIVPTEKRPTLRVAAKEMVAAVAAVQSLATIDNKAKSAIVIMNLAPDVTLSAKSAQGDAMEPMDADWNGKIMAIGFGSNRARIIATAFNGAELSVSIGDPRSPLVFRDGETRLAVLGAMSI